MVYKIIFAEKQSSRGVLLKRCSENMKQTRRRATMYTQDLDKAPLLRSHPRRDTPLKICSTFSEHSPPGEHLWGTTSACQNNLK